MKSLVLLVAMSLMLVGATIVVAIPSTVEAVKRNGAIIRIASMAEAHVKRQTMGECNRVKPLEP